MKDLENIEKYGTHHYSNRDKTFSTFSLVIFWAIYINAYVHKYCWFINKIGYHFSLLRWFRRGRFDLIYTNVVVFKLPPRGPDCSVEEPLGLPWHSWVGVCSLAFFSFSYWVAHCLKKGFCLIVKIISHSICDYLPCKKNFTFISVIIKV